MLSTMVVLSRTSRTFVRQLSMSVVEGKADLPVARPNVCK